MTVHRAPDHLWVGDHRVLDRLGKGGQGTVYLAESPAGARVAIKVLHASSVPGVLHAVLHGEPDLSGVPEPLRSLVAACLAKDPAARPSAQLALRRLTGGEQGPEATLIEPARRLPGRWAAGVAVAVALLVTAGVLVGPSSWGKNTVKNTVFAATGQPEDSVFTGWIKDSDHYITAGTTTPAAPPASTCGSAASSAPTCPSRSRTASARGDRPALVLSGATITSYAEHQGTWQRLHSAPIAGLLTARPGQARLPLRLRPARHHRHDRDHPPGGPERHGLSGSRMRRTTVSAVWSR
ncbi:hypothetical protein AB0K12_41060 [Nonomuraea sp. NPDC049419]|uniref:hypothetical protein n=1 Tax=Nonomuraea sp. NPDC049419 TaxID=3155772 RepID=UPI00343A09B1